MINQLITHDYPLISLMSSMSSISHVWHLLFPKGLCQMNAFCKRNTLETWLDICQLEVDWQLSHASLTGRNRDSVLMLDAWLEPRTY